MRTLRLIALCCRSGSLPAQAGFQKRMLLVTGCASWCIHAVGARKRGHAHMAIHRVQCRGRPKTFDRRRSAGAVIRAQAEPTDDSEGEPVKMDFSLLQVRV